MCFDHGFHAIGDANVYGRWLPSEQHKLDGSEPHKKPRVMDSWYLYHSLLNLSRLAIRGDETAKKLFLDSIDYAIDVARKFKYQFPVFYDLDTKEVIKAEAKEGKGGENDVAGQYAHVMMQAWDLTKEKRFLEEAQKAAKSIQGLGFNMMYQANSTIFSSGALLRLWKETGDDLYLHLSFVTLANIFNNMWLWECDYGYAKNYSTFFALFPLKDAVYTAVYEEIEAVVALHDYLSYLDGKNPEWLNILIPEFTRALMFKAGFYYPPNLPEEAIAQETGTGEIDRKLWIPLEDIHDGWEQAGQVGQGTRLFLNFSKVNCISSPFYLLNFLPFSLLVVKFRVLWIVNISIVMVLYKLFFITSFLHAQQQP